MATATPTAPPHTHSQPSRKGKRAWRKNVDLTTIQSGLEEARNQLTLTGGQLLADVPSTALFQTDVAGSTQLKSQARKAHPLLRANEIIAQRSAVPPVNNVKHQLSTRVTDGVLEPSSKRRRGGGVSRKELERLKHIAYGGEATLKDIIATDDTATHDPWAVSAPQLPAPTQTFLEAPVKKREPPTLKQAPVSLTLSGKPLPHVRKPLAGRSYNPAFSDWTSLLAQEGAKEMAAEARRQAEAAVEAEREARVAAALAEAEREEERAAEAAALGEYDESEWEGIQSELEEAQLRKRRPVRKTPAERNKILRRKTAERLVRHERSMREREEQEKRIVAIRRELDGAAAGGKSQKAGKDAMVAFAGSVQSDASDEADVEEAEEEEQGEALRRRRLGKVHVPEAPLELVLADELQDSLRRLRPEGNLLRDRFRNVIVQGRIEARRPLGQQRKKRVKVTEKWTSKDWSLENR